MTVSQRASGAPISRRQLSNRSERGPAVEKGLGQGTTHPPLPPNYQMSVGLLQERALEKSCNLLRQTVNYFQESAWPGMRLPFAGLTPNAEPSLQANAHTHTHSAGIRYPILTSLCLIMRFQRSQSWKITSALPVGLHFLPSSCAVPFCHLHDTVRQHVFVCAPVASVTSGLGRETSAGTTLSGFLWLDFWLVCSCFFFSRSLSPSVYSVRPWTTPPCATLPADNYVSGRE